MRTLSLLLLLSSASFAQRFVTLFPQNVLNDRPLREYLQITDAQWNAIRSGPPPALADARIAIRARQQNLLSEIIAETGRSSLRPLELGRLHVEWEQSRRHALQIGDQLRQARLAVLDSTQREKLALIERARPLAPIAADVGLAYPDCGDQSFYFGINALPSFSMGQDPVCQPPPVPAVNYLATPLNFVSTDDALVRFLNLTSSQEASFQQNRETIFESSEVDRMGTLAQEIQQETARPELDPLALGLRYAELESLRRSYSERVRRLEAANREVLTSTQRERLAILEEATRLQSPAWAARSQSLIGRRCTSLVYFLDNANGESILPGSSSSVFSFYAGDCPDTTALDQLP
ncbi:MAG: hypothetical protein K2Q23_02400 [Bryobacteraceae bacterium]|nr:hypothetical protein [Bryobacteraceae bacterium]